MRYWPLTLPIARLRRLEPLARRSSHSPLCPKSMAPKWQAGALSIRRLLSSRVACLFHWLADWRTPSPKLARRLGSAPVLRWPLDGKFRLWTRHNATLGRSAGSPARSPLHGGACDRACQPVTRRNTTSAHLAIRGPLPRCDWPPG